MSRVMYATILGIDNKKTTLFNAYWLGNTAIKLVGYQMVTKQQCMLMEQNGRYEHPHHAIIED